MKWHKRVRVVLYCWWIRLRLLPLNIRGFIWNRHILYWWHRSSIPEDEFDLSLEMDFEAMSSMTKKQEEHYRANQVRR